MRNTILFIFFLTLFFACKEDVLPKPKAYLSLEYPKKTYKKLNLNRPYSFKIATIAKVIDEANNWLKIKYPNLKASIDLTYRPVKNNI